MDGNGRWARSRGLDRSEGHEAGYHNIEPVIEWLGEAGVKYATLFSFSTENWGRPQDEVNGLLDLLALGLEEQVDRLHNRGVRLLHVGSLDRLPPAIADGVRAAVDRTARNPGLTLCLAFDYGGRQDIVQAVRRLITEGVPPGAVTEQEIARRLYTSGVPDPDLIIRTGGEFRISNFLLWQSAYSEFFSTGCNWPDVGPRELAAALEAYAGRERRFGLVDSPGAAGHDRSGR